MTAAGSGHWRWQRISAILLIPFTFWFMFSVVHYTGSEFDELIGWISRPWVAGSLLLYLVTMFYHAWLGVQVVIEDYVHSPGLNHWSLLLVKGVLSLCALASCFAVLRIAL